MISVFRASQASWLIFLFKISICVILPQLISKLMEISSLKLLRHSFDFVLLLVLALCWIPKWHSDSPPKLPQLQIPVWQGSLQCTPVVISFLFRINTNASNELFILGFSHFCRDIFISYILCDINLSSVKSICFEQFQSFQHYFPVMGFIPLSFSKGNNVISALMY